MAHETINARLSIGLPRLTMDLLLSKLLNKLTNGQCDRAALMNIGGDDSIVEILN